MRGRIAFVIGMLSAGCSDVQRLNLPNQPDADVAFGILYDGQTPVQLGPVVTPGVIYTGNYTLRDREGLDARLFFFRKDDLVAAGESVCLGLGLATERARCRAAVTACSEDPLGCVVPTTGEEACQDRLLYPSTLPVLSMVSIEGILQTSRTTLETLPSLTICGPVIRPPCPNLLPGFVITDDAGYRCLAEATQASCKLTIDMSACGLGSTVANIDAAGRLTADSGACRVEALTTPPVLGDGAAVTLTCGDRTVVATAMGEQLAEQGCRREGPPHYLTELSSGDNRVGRIAGIVAIQPAGWPVRWAMTGVGLDSCAARGCRQAGVDCGNGCDIPCDGFDIKYCAREPWPACTELDRRTTCKERCRSFCQRAATDRQGCTNEASGEIVSLSDPAVVERTVDRVHLSGQVATAIGTRGIIALAPEADPTLIAVVRDRVYALRPNGVDRLSISSSVPVDFTPASVAVIDPRGDVVVFGAGPDDIGRWIRLTVDGGLVAVADGPFDIPELPEATLGAARGTTLFFASRRQTAEHSPSLVSLDVDSRTPTVQNLSGPATDMIVLPNGSILVTYRTEAGGGIFVVDESGSVSETPVLPGLHPQAMAVDSHRCTLDACQVWIGYEPAFVAGPAVVGRIEVQDRAARIGIPPALVGLPIDRVQLLTVDAQQDQIVAAHTSQDQIAPLAISLPR
ncbi:MAG: hypothetical protein AAF449_09205 [Myxococcota bacterium]